MVRPPRGASRSIKYIVDEPEASETAGLQSFTMVVGTDNATLGQTGATDTAIPVGSKIKLFDIRAVFGNLTSINDFIYWSIERKASGQGTVNPKSPGGNPLRKNILLSGLFMVGKDQNRVLHVRYKVPKKYQRIADGDTWRLNYDLGVVTTTAKQVVYKVFQ